MNTKDRSIEEMATQAIKSDFVVGKSKNGKIALIGGYLGWMFDALDFMVLALADSLYHQGMESSPG